MEGSNINGSYNFANTLEQHHLLLEAERIETLQVNITRRCNQACSHCHVDASPQRTEQMDLRTIDRCLEILSANKSITRLDITGGAPELNPYYKYFITEARKLSKAIDTRHNLTITVDGDPQTGEDMSYLPAFFAENRLEVIASMPHYHDECCDLQRGPGVFEKSLKGLKLLNERGYGTEGSGLLLTLVHNPIGPALPAPQSQLEIEFKRELAKFNVFFNNLITITNMPVSRFKRQLDKEGKYQDYMQLLIGSFNPEAARHIMCRSLVSIGYDGRIYDCDFNQMAGLGLAIEENSSIFNADFNRLSNRRIRYAIHCYGCTAGSGSSCSGSLA